MESKKTFAHSAARISLFLAIGAGVLYFVMLLGRVLPIYMAASTSAILYSVAGTGLFVLLVLSVVCGFIALSGIKHHGREGVLIPASIGLTLSALMLIPMLYGVGLAVGTRINNVRARNTEASRKEPARGQEVPSTATFVPTKTAEAPAPANFIAAAERADVAYEATGNILYISAGPQLLRYHFGSNSFMSPLEFGGSLAGLDFSPDGRTLAIADRTRAGSQVWIHLFDVAAGTNSKAVFTRASMEGGTFSVAFGSDGAVYVTSTFEGSGTVPLRRYDPVRRSVSEIRKVNQDTMLCPSANRHLIGFAESNTSGGNHGAYDVRTRKVAFEDRADRFLWEIAANRDGTQFAIPTYRDTLIHGPDPRAIGGNTGDGRPIGAVFHPGRDVACFAWSDSSSVRVFDTRNWRETDRIDVGVQFENVGNRAFVQGRLKMSQDGSWLFCTVKGGVWWHRPKWNSETFSADRR